MDQTIVRVKKEGEFYDKRGVVVHWNKTPNDSGAGAIVMMDSGQFKFFELREIIRYNGHEYKSINNDDYIINKLEKDKK